jgi:hypothetical protein
MHAAGAVPAAVEALYYLDTAFSPRLFLGCALLVACAAGWGLRLLVSTVSAEARRWLPAWCAVDDMVVQALIPYCQQRPLHAQGAADGGDDGGGESKRLVVESPWSQFTSECQRF